MVGGTPSVMGLDEEDVGAVLLPLARDGAGDCRGPASIGRMGGTSVARPCTPSSVAQGGRLDGGPEGAPLEARGVESSEHALAWRRARQADGDSVGARHGCRAARR